MAVCDELMQLYSHRPPGNYCKRAEIELLVDLWVIFKCRESTLLGAAVSRSGVAMLCLCIRPDILPSHRSPRVIKVTLHVRSGALGQ